MQQLETWPLLDHLQVGQQRADKVESAVCLWASRKLGLALQFLQDGASLCVRTTAKGQRSEPQAYS